jgi:hypothetical protein
MKRALLILVAALLVLLVYPSTHPAEASSKTAGVPCVVSPKGNVDPPIALTGEGDSSGDSGDADDLSGIKTGKRLPGGASNIGTPANPTRLVVVLKMWWNYLIWVR